LQPDVLLMPTSPHTVYDYVAYALAKQRGIRSVMFEYVTTEGLLMAIGRFEDGLARLTAAYEKLRTNPPQPIVLSARLENYWKRLQGSYEEAIPIYTRQFLEAGEAARKAEIKQLGVRYGP